MKKVYYLSSCSTCKKILEQLPANEDLEKQDIKTNKITASQLEEMKRLSGSFESLFSRRAMKYKSLGLKEKSLSEEDYRQLILEEYTFLKRPVVIIEGQIFIGSSKSTVDALISTLSH